jgi:hypothetical protein
MLLLFSSQLFRILLASKKEKIARKEDAKERVLWSYQKKILPRHLFFLTHTHTKIQKNETQKLKEEAQKKN